MHTVPVLDFLSGDFLFLIVERLHFQYTQTHSVLNLKRIRPIIPFDTIISINMKLKIIIPFSKITSIIIILNGWNPWGCVRLLKQSLKIIISKVRMPFNVTSASRKIADTLQSKKRKNPQKRTKKEKQNKTTTNNNTRRDQQPAQRNQLPYTKINNINKYPTVHLPNLVLDAAIPLINLSPLVENDLEIKRLDNVSNI